MTRLTPNPIPANYGLLLSTTPGLSVRHTGPAGLLGSLIALNIITGYMVKKKKHSGKTEGTKLIGGHRGSFEERVGYQATLIQLCRPTQSSLAGHLTGKEGLEAL